MSSSFGFGGTMVIVNSSYRFIIAEYIRPYIMSLGRGIMERIYFDEDVCWYGCGNSFAELTVEEYMDCYHIMCYAFERRLPSVFGDFLKEENKERIIEIWQEELKPAMESTPLFLSGFHINEGNFVHVQDKELLTFVADYIHKPILEADLVGNFYQKILYHYSMDLAVLYFSKLKPDEFMLSYKALECTLEEKLVNDTSIENDELQLYAIDFWRNQLKPKMQASPFYKTGDIE